LPLLRDEWGKVDEISFSAYFGVQNQGRAKGVLRAKNGDWLAVVIASGRGRICLQAFSADLKDSSLPRSSAFVPMVQEIVDFLAEEPEDFAPDAIRAGERTYMQLPEFRGLAGQVEVQGPETYHFPVASTGRDVKIENLHVAGNYRIFHLQKKTARHRWLSVNPVPDESDLSTITEEEQKTLFGDVHVFRLPFSEMEGQFERRQEIFPLLMGLVFAALVLETCFGAWQSRRREVNRE
jgi:hypothetical protein